MVSVYPDCIRNLDYTFMSYEQTDQSHFTRWAATYDRGIGGYFFRKSYKKVLSVLNPKPGQKVVDLACGTGGFIAELLKFRDGETSAVDDQPHPTFPLERGGGQIEIIGLDYTEAMLEVARQKFEGNPRVSLMASSAERVPLAEKSADIVYCLDAFHHFLHADEALKEVRRVLKPDGRFVILDPVDDGWRKVMHLVMPFIGESHTFARNTNKWHELLARHGFEIEYERRWMAFFKMFIVHVKITTATAGSRLGGKNQNGK